MSKTKWISHRGYKKDAPENTAEAFRAAVDLGFRDLETDLRVTSDDHLVLVHDPSLERILGISRSVISLSRAELEAIRFPKGQRILFFDQFIEEFAGCGWTLDIKPEHGDRTVASLIKWCKSRKTLEWIGQQARFLTWRKEHEAAIRQDIPAARFYADRNECWRAGLAVLLGMPSLGALEVGRIYALPPTLGPLDLYKRRYVDRFHAASAKVIAFLPETDAEVRKALDARVDEILTNGTILV